MEERKLGGLNAICHSRKPWIEDIPLARNYS
jgi:hypothetical protein